MKKNLLTVLVLALSVVNIVLTSVLMFSVMGTNKKTADLVSNIATVLNLELTEPGQTPEQQVSLEDTEVYNFSGALTIPLSGEVGEDGSLGDGKQRYIMFELALSMNKKNKDYKTYGATIDSRESLIEDVVRSTVSQYTESECREDLANGLGGLKEDILEAIQNLFQSDFIYNVAITDVKFG